MKFLNDNILKYGIHDTSFNTVKIGKKGISLSFNNGDQSQSCTPIKRNVSISTQWRSTRHRPAAHGTAVSIGSAPESASASVHFL